MPSTSSLCDYCNLIFSTASFNVEKEDVNIVEGYVRTDTLPELPSLQRAVKGGCSFCAELKRRIAGLEWPEEVREIDIGPATLIHESFWEAELTPEQEGIAMIEVTVGSAQGDTTNLLFEIFALPSSYASTQMRVRRRPPSIDRISSECIEVLQNMIAKCADVHWQCDPGQEDFWPTRVIDVGPTDGSIDPRLMATSGRASKYLALSHCWGRPGPGIRTLRTLLTSMHSYMQGIPLDSMPQNFQHAIFMTRALGLRYIWIDSLCIIQDSTEDWAAEGSQMDKIYKYAYVTLAATSASTSEDGFLDYALKDRMFSVQLPHGREPSAPSIATETIIARYMKTRHNDRMEPDVEDTTWNTRGWTLQERHLSRRILHFCKTQIFWECRRGFASECGQRIGRLPFSITRTYGANDSSDELSEENSSGSEETSIELKDDASIETDSGSEHCVEDETTATRTGLYNWWFQILADYSRRKLTYASDKLPAISGLVKELNMYHFEITQKYDQYVAGIWTGALGDSLLWIPEDPACMIDPGMYRAPSFSWARWDGVISPGGWTNLRPESSLVEYIDHETVLETTNEYGSIKSAIIRLRAGVIEIKCRGRHGKGVTSYVMTLADVFEHLGFVTFDRIEDMHCEREKDGLYAMQVKVQDASDPSGLILRPTGARATFERIGVFQLDEKHLHSFSSISREVVTLI